MGRIIPYRDFLGNARHVSAYHKRVCFSLDGGDGTPDLENLAFEPPHTQWNVQGARAVIKGAAALDAANWPEVTEQNKAGFRFFKVEVELP